MEDYIIKEDYTLPSLGKIYSKPVDPNVTIRSMTTEDEMKRLGHSDRPYKMLSEIIDDCLVKKPNISSYDMCAGDFQYLMHKLRIVTYGPDYQVITVCPICGAKTESTVNLDDLEVHQYSDDYSKYLNIKLPVTGHNIKLRVQTPHILDDIAIQIREMNKKSPNMKGDIALLLNLESVIETVDNEVYNPVELDTFIRKLPARDSNCILRNLEKLNEKIGLETTFDCVCSKCGAETKQILPITGEFFRPTTD